MSFQASSPPRHRRKPALLGLTLDGRRLEAALLRRTNGSVQVVQTCRAALALDPLTNAPELVGREIRNQLNAAGLRERACVVGLPLQWVLVAHTTLPELPEADIPGFLQLEAERLFPCDVATLFLATGRHQSTQNTRHATLVAVPRSHLELLDKVLHAAQLKPVSFTLGLQALQPPEDPASAGVLALALEGDHVALQVTAGGGVLALRVLNDALEEEGGQRRLNLDAIIREIRITLGQLPPQYHQAVRQIRVFGPPELADELVTELRARFAPLGMQTERVAGLPGEAWGLHLPPGLAPSAALSLAVRHLAGRRAPFELMPPKITAWQRWRDRYSTGTLQRAALAAAAAAVLVMGGFIHQQIQLWNLQSEWARIAPQVHQLEDTQLSIRRFRPWFDTSLRTLSILRQLTESFPESGTVWVRSVEIREPGAVTCSGVARDNQAWLKTLDRLHAAPQVSDLKVDVVRGKSPMQFTFNFQWVEGGRK